VPAFAQVTIPEEYDKLIKHRDAITPMGADDFGGRIDLATGGFSIVQTDIDLPGNNGLQVRVGRTFSPGSASHGDGHFGRWDMDIPYLHGTFFGLGTALANWTVAATSGPNQQKRCSLFGPPPAVVIQGGIFDADEYWQGNMLHLPGGSEQELLLAPGTPGSAPTDGHAYPVSTQLGAVARCLASLDPTSQSGSQGEGFEVVMPDGTVYTFDHMVVRYMAGIKKGQPGPVMLKAQSGGLRTAVADPGGPTPNVAVNYVMPRQEVFLYPTRVTDRFGNTVTYNWSASNPWRLLQIVASDGRQLDFSYPTGDPDSYQIVSITDGTRTWSYGSGVTLPDGSKWTYSFGNLVLARPRPSGVTCDLIANVDGNTYTASITAPSGATMTYSISPRLFGRSNVWRECIHYTDGVENPREPYMFAGLAVTSRTLTGPGLPAAGLTWTYAYGPANQCWAPASVIYPGAGAVLCTSSSPNVRTTTVTTPDGAVSRYSYGNRFNDNEGLLVKEEHGLSGGSALRVVEYEYGSPDAAPYAALSGYSARNLGDYSITSRSRPRRKVVTTQQGRTFTWEVATGCNGNPYCFDEYARPTKVMKKSGGTP